MKNYWNYRICTKLDNGFRVFTVCECYYEGGSLIPDSYIDSKNLLIWENSKDLGFTIDKLTEAKSKPILDLDNWPNEYKSSKTKKKNENKS